MESESNISKGKKNKRDEAMKRVGRKRFVYRGLGTTGTDKMRGYFHG
jgi:hypothetical protein